MLTNNTRIHIYIYILCNKVQYEHIRQNAIRHRTNMSDGDEINNSIQELIQCSACLRRMRSDVFTKHPNVCPKNLTKQRTVPIFDMTRYRSVKAGDQVIPVCKISSSNNKKPNNINVRPSQTRSTKRDRHSDTLVPPIINNFCCPTCKRTFCEKAYDRHVAFCTQKIKQIQQPPSDDVLLARFKLDRRIKFGSNRIVSTFSKTAPNLPKPHINQDPPKEKLPSQPFCLLSLGKNFLQVV
ncbi:hypothetical protein I4U23_013892 [Adineta vaga]|nr:hypothetical protein I4U23_013892 [Adineta vaga]